MCAKVRMISRYLLVSCGLVLVSFVHASSLPTDGGSREKHTRPVLMQSRSPIRLRWLRFVLQRMIRGSKGESRLFYE